MSEMVERVARALVNLRCARKGCGATDDCGLDPEELEEARAAIAAMRDPTEAMVDAGSAAISGPHKILGGPGMRKMAIEAYRAMIDEGLKP